MPLVTGCLVQIVPKECKSLAAAIFCVKAPFVGQHPFHLTEKDVPALFASPEHQLAQWFDQPGVFDARLLAQFAQDSLAGFFVFLYSAFDNLATGQWVAKGQDLQTSFPATKEYGAGFVSEFQRSSLFDRRLGSPGRFSLSAIL